MISKIDRLNIDKIVSQIGFPINTSDFRSAYICDVDTNTAMEFEKKLKKAKNPQDIIAAITSYSKIFDKALYVLHIGRLLEKDIENIKRYEMLNEVPKQLVFTNDSTGKNKRRVLVTAKEMLKNSDVVDLGMNQETGEIVVYTAKEFYDDDFSIGKFIQKAEERLSGIEEILRLPMVLQQLEPSDLTTICEYTNLGKMLILKLTKGKENIETNSENSIGKFNLVNETQTYDKIEFEKIIRKYIPYINIDKMLLLASVKYYCKYGRKLNKFSADEAKQLQGFINKVAAVIENKKLTVNSPVYNVQIDIKNVISDVDILNKHFINGKYHEYAEISNLINDIITGKKPITIVSVKELREVLNLTEKDISVLTRNVPGSLEYLVENKVLQKYQVEAVLKANKKISIEQIIYLVKNNLIDEKALLKLYDREIVTVKAVKAIKDGAPKKITSKIVSVKKLRELYEDKESAKAFERYRKLFKAVAIDELDEFGEDAIEKKIEVGNDIVSEFDDLINNDSIYDLYFMGLIQAENLSEYIHIDEMLKLYAVGKIKPTDARRLYKNGIFNEEMFEKIFKDPSLNEIPKLILIYSTFPSNSEEDTELRNKFLKEVSNTLRDNSENKNAYQTVFAKWDLISSLDKDYSQEFLSDGHIIFYLPNEEKCIIEKVYDKNNKPAYGAATYILDEEVYKENINIIVRENSINKEYFLSQYKHRSSGVKKIVHTGWINSIVQFFDEEKEEKNFKERAFCLDNINKNNLQ